MSVFVLNYIINRCVWLCRTAAVSDPLFVQYQSWKDTYIQKARTGTSTHFLPLRKPKKLELCAAAAGPPKLLAEAVGSFEFTPCIDSAAPTLIYYMKSVTNLQLRIRFHSHRIMFSCKWNKTVNILLHFVMMEVDMHLRTHIWNVNGASARMESVVIDLSSP